MTRQELSPRNPRTAVICVGSELLRGKINTHASTLARRLVSVGLTLDAEQTVGDELAPLVQAITQGLRHFDIVLVTGGLGPTFDDITREAAAQATGRTLRKSATLLSGIRRKFRRARYKKMPATNERQAFLIEGARAIDNTMGTAPGQWLQIGAKHLFLLPGPPSELNPMVERFVLPTLKKQFRALPTAEAHLHFVGIAESMVDQAVRPIITRAEAKFGGEIRFTILAHLGLVDFDIYMSDPSVTRAERALSRLVKEISVAMGDRLYGTGTHYPLARVVGERFIAHQETLAVAESCTGGMLANKLTDIAGSSAFFLGGVVSYDNSVKENLLNVPSPLLKKYGAVSEPVAAAMADGARSRVNSTWGLSITGVAGPGGGTPKKPVGTVFIGIAGPRARTGVYKFQFNGSRDVVRQRATTTALDLLRAL